MNAPEFDIKVKIQGTGVVMRNGKPVPKEDPKPEGK